MVVKISIAVLHSDNVLVLRHLPSRDGGDNLVVLQILLWIGWIVIAGIVLVLGIASPAFLLLLAIAGCWGMLFIYYQGSLDILANWVVVILLVVQTAAGCVALDLFLFAGLLPPANVLFNFLVLRQVVNVLVICVWLVPEWVVADGRFVGLELWEFVQVLDLFESIASLTLTEEWIGFLILRLLLVGLELVHAINSLSQIQLLLLQIAVDIASLIVYIITVHATLFQRLLFVLNLKSRACLKVVALALFINQWLVFIFLNILILLFNNFQTLWVEQLLFLVLAWQF